MKYRITGSFRIKNKLQKFKKNIEGENENEALRKFYSIMGNSHRLKRKNINIEKIEKM
jgi:ribosomal protein L20A (L18A)